MSSTKNLKESEFVTREKPLATAIELCPDMPEILALQKRSQAVKRNIDMYLVKVKIISFIFASSILRYEPD